ncbi:MAG: beta-ketoacyl-ACP synthase III [Gammaproteobacteria bacterium CG11_big_fil_rev_8_21_14_0_20_46_22]|nr:MAG: beta-ketoacyl-ACP synthase III [Gammaproteobacteria bacterium CG12_big_fil_rev_8_21_14_0_65_46_12]PIR10903.1 MAG: beta-ketoacyl-ACP synthase III [Gammaproteobacteria bacterium CG11_big_fil_rev_8_21_14_0_20_46_22]
MNDRIFISGTGLYHPEHAVSNEALVQSYNAYVEHYNDAHAKAIEAGELEPLKASNPRFIEKVSGIKSRYLMDAEHVLDPNSMQPSFAPRKDDEMSIQAEMAIAAAKRALDNANKSAEDIDMIIVACSNFQRAYPAISIEVQQALGAKGFAFDMNVACSSATFAIAQAYSAIKTGLAKTALLINPEICSAHLNFRNRDSHFIFGDACTATIVECENTLSKQDDLFEIVDTRLTTQFSNNIRNNFGFLTRVESDVQADLGLIYTSKYLFEQLGRRVFKDVVPLVSSMIVEHLKANGLSPEQVKRFWLHQANAHMNELIAEKILGRKPSADEAPIILDEFGNTSSPGCLIAFHRYHNDLAVDDYGLLSSFGAGYSAGNILVKKVA